MTGAINMEAGAEALMNSPGALLQLGMFWQSRNRVATDRCLHRNVGIEGRKQRERLRF